MNDEHHVFRTAVFSIVFSLAVGQNVGLLCRTWCDAHVAPATECHHKNSSTTPTIGGDEDCGNPVAATAVLRDIRRNVVSQDPNQAIPVLRYQFARLTIDAGPDPEPGRDWSLEQRPLATPLRI